MIPIYFSMLIIKALVSAVWASVSAALRILVSVSVKILVSSHPYSAIQVLTKPKPIQMTNVSTQTESVLDIETECYNSDFLGKLQQLLTVAINNSSL